MTPRAPDAHILALVEVLELDVLEVLELDLLEVLDFLVEVLEPISLFACLNWPLWNFCVSVHMLNWPWLISMTKTIFRLFTYNKPFMYGPTGPYLYCYNLYIL